MRSAGQWRTYLQSMTSKECIGHRSKVHSLEWNISGSKLASGSTDHSVRIWLLDSLQGRATSSELKGHEASVDQLAWSPVNAELLASASADKTARLWDTAAMTLLATIQLSSETINIAWNSDGTKLVVGGKDDTVTIIDVSTRQPIVKQKFAQEINELAWSPHSNQIFATRASGSIDIFDGATLEIVDSLQGHPANCYCIQFDPHGRYFAVGGADSIVSLWDTTERACIRTFCRLQWPIRAISFNSDGDVLASASEDPFIDVAYVPTGELLYKLPTASATNTLAWHPKRSILAYAGDHVDSRTGRSTGAIYILAAP